MKVLFFIPLVAIFAIVSTLAGPVQFEKVNCDLYDENDTFSRCNCNADKYLQIKSNKCDIVEKYRMGAIYYGCLSSYYCLETFGKNNYTIEDEEGNVSWNPDVVNCLGSVFTNFRGYVTEFTELFFQLPKNLVKGVDTDFITVNGYSLDWYEKDGKNSEECVNMEMTGVTVQY